MTEATEQSGSWNGKKLDHLQKTDSQHIYGMRKSIFRPFKDQNEKDKRTSWIHNTFKKGIVYPGMRFAGWFMDKFLDKWIIKERKDIPDEPYNANLQILWDAFEDGIKDWNYNFYRMKKKWDGPVSNAAELDENWKNRMQYHWYAIPKRMLQVMMTIYLEDTAYREQLNCIMFQIQKKMNDQWDPGKQTKFPMYTNKFDMEPAYLLEWLKASGFKGQVLVNIDNEEARKAAAEGGNMIQANEELVKNDKKESESSDIQQEGSGGNHPAEDPGK